MINETEAKAMAMEAIDRLQTESGISLELIDAATEPFDDGWIFYYDSVAFRRTRNFAYAIAGNAPFVVFKNGVIRNAPTGCLTTDAILKWLKEHPDG